MLPLPIFKAKRIPNPIHVNTWDKSIKLALSTPVISNGRI